ncbi:hypothetical protein M422DRAFT_56288 [Sphaerobolus stellatus SS14]|uniref:SWIM-type domain-containing protein n=1 Tax=Sphaerobolus stellatus (strain SS14) TaxID=990650 RepID=A0A0C9T6Z2_SPHS4|nr:hypothetical protein M422DRAFT_56288 [Sphaerobolus stellatus SS14]
MPVVYPESVVLNCYSSMAMTLENNPTIYQVSLGFNGMATCTCQDFQNHGGECKHLRATVLHVDAHCQAGWSIPPTPLPVTEGEARILYGKVTSTQVHSTLEFESQGESLIMNVVSFVNDLLGDTAASVGIEETDSESEEEEPTGPTEDDLEDLESVATNADDSLDFVCSI